MVSLQAKRESRALIQRRRGTVLNWIGQAILALGGVYVLFQVIVAASQNPGVFFQQVLNGLQLGFIYALVALGYTMIYGIVKLINFAHGDVFMVGAFTSFFAISMVELHRWPLLIWPGMNEGVSTLVGSATVILLAMFIAGFLAVVMERFAYRSLRNKPRIAALITAIGVSFFIEYFAALPFSYTNNYITYPRPFDIYVLRSSDISSGALIVVWALFLLSLITCGVLILLGRRGNQRAHVWSRHPLIQFALLLGGFLTLVLTLVVAFPVVSGQEWDLTVSNVTLVIMVSSILLQVVLQYIVQHTRLGKAMRASAYDKPTARLMGINVDMVIAATFALGGGLAGAAGVLYATAFKQVHHLMGIIPGLKAFVAAVIGGIGSIPGALVGALIMGQTEVLSAGFISTPMRDAIAFSMLIIVLLIRPQGIFGEPPTEKV
ncbi:MAG TPA: branched-chain amino acid ABC transporter permease [Chloroflexi bacterium]|nr:branched-chain amino acid ABC transporter permease [Chloroflexota bacterium]